MAPRKDPPKKVGRPKWLPTEEILEKVRTYAALGLTRAQLSWLVGFTPQLWSEKIKEFSELAEAYEQGRMNGIAFATSKLHEMMKDKHYPAVQFFLKAKANWKENDPTSESHQPIVITVAGKEVKIGAGHTESND